MYWDYQVHIIFQINAFFFPINIIVCLFKDILMPKSPSFSMERLLQWRNMLLRNTAPKLGFFFWAFWVIIFKARFQNYWWFLRKIIVLSFSVQNYSTCLFFPFFSPFWLELPFHGGLLLFMFLFLSGVIVSTKKKTHTPLSKKKKRTRFRGEKRHLTTFPPPL